MKRTKLKRVPTKKISKDDVDQIDAIYAIPPQYVNGCYLTPGTQDKSTFVRITFSEFNFTLQKQVPRVAIVASIEDVQTIYNAMTELLQQMRTMGRIA